MYDVVIEHQEILMYCRGGDENIESLLEQDASFYEFQRNYSPEESKSHDNLLVPSVTKHWYQARQG